MALQRKGDRFLLFLKAFSWEPGLWVTLVNFTVKKRKIVKEYLYLAENGLSRKCSVRQIITIICVLYKCKNIFRFEL